MACLPSVQQCKELIAGQLAIPKDLGEEAGANRLSTVHRYDGDSTIRVPQEVMAPSDSHVFEACAFEGFYQVFTRRARKPCHETTEMVWIPTKSRDSMSSPCSSTQSATASRIRSIT